MNTVGSRDKWSVDVFGCIVSKQNSGGNLCSCITSVFRKKTYTGLLTNYFYSLSIQIGVN